MKRYGLMILGIALLLGACRDEDEIGPIMGEKDWFVLEDSEDPIDGKRYDIYAEFGIPVYYNDTIGSEPRLSVSGDPYIYYECLKVFYNPGGTPITNGRYTLLKDKNDTKEVLDYLETEILPVIPESFYIPSILLVDTLVIGADSLAYKGFNTVVCAKVKEFAGMDEENRKWWRGGVLSALLVNGLISDEAEWLNEDFFGKSQAVNPESDRVYSSSRNWAVYQALAERTDIPAAEQTLGVLGFLNHKWKPSYAGQQERMAYVPTQEEDLKYYCEAIFAMSIEEFTERWGEYPVVMAKYEALKGKLAEYGFEFE